MEAFTQSTRRAHSDFVTPKLGIGESDDVYTADLRRLLTAVGLQADGKCTDRAVYSWSTQ